MKLVLPSISTQTLKQEHQLNEIAVIKFGGSAIIDDTVMLSVIDQTATLVKKGLRPVIVHGGGPKINHALTQSGITTQKICGLRVTDSSSLAIIEQVLSQINHNLVQCFQASGVNAVSLFAQAKVLNAQKLWLADKEHHIDLGWVGLVKSVDGNLLEQLLRNNLIPVVAPIGVDAQGSLYNINADHAAVAVAKALSAKRLIFITDVDGVLMNENDPQSRITQVIASQIPLLIKNKVISGGMIPKMESCMEASENGIEQVQIINGCSNQAILKAFLMPEQIGTIVKQEPQRRRA